MIQITDENRPKCKNFERCGQLAITYTQGIWLCGKCLMNLQEKLKELKEKIIIQEGEDADTN